MKYVNYDNLETAKEMIKVALEKKVDKEDGKGLSTNDYTNEEKIKLAGIEEEANKTIVDSELSLESTNPVENKIVKEALDTKADKIDVKEALDTKADKVAVEEALETKADKQEVAEALDTKVDKETGKGLSTNDFTDEEKEKLSKLDINSNENVIEVIKQNGEVLEIHNKSVNIVTITEDTIDNKIENAVKNVEVDLKDYAKRSDIPKNVSDLFNDKAFIASSDEKDPTVPAHVKAITKEDIEKWNSGTGTGSGNETCNVVVDAVEPSNGEAIWIKLAKNLCHFNNVKNEYSINSSGKVISDYMWSKWLTTDFIEVEPDTVYTLSGIRYGSSGRYHAWYDSNKNPISAFVRYIPAGDDDSQTVTSPSNAKYIRFSIYNGYGVTKQDERLYFQFEKGSVATSYAPYSGKSDMFVKNSNGEYEQIYEAFPVPSSENEQYTLPAATASTLGGIKVGNNLTVDADGTLHAQAGGGGVSEETDPTVPAYVKAITEEDIAKWNSGTGTSVSDAVENQEIMQIGVTSSFTLSVSSAWQLLTVPFTTNKMSVGNNLSITPEGHIKIGKGISKVSVRGNILVTSTATGLIDMRIYIIRDGQEINSAATYLGLDKAKSYRTVYVELPMLEVQENDEICIKVTSEVSCSLTVADNAYLCVEKILDTNVIAGGGGNVTPTDFNTKWINAELTEHFKLYNDSSYCRYSKVGNMVNIQFVLSPAKSDNVLNSATETTAFTLPEEYRPSQNLNVLCQGSTTYVFNVGVNASGNVNIYRYRNSSSYSSNPPLTTAWLPCNITYFVDSGEMIVGSGSSTIENGVVLYENEEGSGGPITLSKSLSEFKYVEIFYSYLGNTWGYDYTKIEDPDGKLTNLTMTVLNNDKIYTTTSTWSLNGTEVVRTKGERFRFDTTPVITRAENAEDIVINKIIGHYGDSSSGGGTTNTVEKLSKVLYEDNTGSTTSVTLSETSANFKYMEIYCKSTDNTYTSVKVHEPNGKRVTATSGWFGGFAYYKNSVIDILDDKITFSSHNAAEITGKNLSNTVSTTDTMSIVKVVGYYDEPSFIGGSGGGNIDLSNYVTKEELPTKVSELENDSNYINKIKTINGQSLIGNGNIVIVGGDGSGDGLPEVSVGVDTPGMGESLWLKTRENLFNKDTITPDVYINEAGELATHTTWNVSDFIPVEPGVNYTYRNAMHYGSAAYVGFYNADKELVSTVHQVLGANTITIADGVAYVRLSLSDLDISNLIFEQCSSDEIFNDTVCVKRSDGTYQEFLQENNPEIMTVQLSADTSMSIGSAWTRYTIPFNKIITQIGSNLTLTPEGKIKIGKGIRAISINCTMLYGSSLSMIETASRYKRGGTTKNINAAYDKGSGASTYYTLANVYPAFPVTEGDEIDFAITAASSGSVSVQKEGTFLCVQKIV
jgi:hypothetical protein